MIGFLAPLFLAGVAAAAIPIALHLFRRRTHIVVKFAAMRYLRSAPVEDSHARRLRELLLLTLRVTALLLLAFAFARPYVSRAASMAPATVVLIDTSASLTAPGQFERVRDLAHESVRGAPVSHDVAIVTFGAAAGVVVPLSADRAAAHAAIDALSPGGGATRYREALMRGAELLADRSGRLVVITDLQKAGWDAGDVAVPAAVEVLVQDAGAPSANLAVASVALRDGDIITTVRNFSAAEAKEQVTFRVDGRPFGAALVRVPPHGSADVRLGLERGGAPDAAAIVEATVTDRTGYAADNTRFAVIDPNAGPAVLAVTNTGQSSDAFYFHRAATVGDGPEGFRLTAADGSSLSRFQPDALAAFDVVAIFGSRGIAASARDGLDAFVRAGGGLLLVAGPDVDPGVLARAADGVVRSTWSLRGHQALTLAADDGRHPIFRPFADAATLGNVAFSRAVVVTPGEGAVVLARYSDGSPALVEERVGAGRVLLFASDLNDRWNNFPLQPAYVPFVHELLRYLAGTRARQSEFVVGDIASAPDAAGVVTHGGRTIAVNVDAREFDPAPMSADAFLAAVKRLTADAARQSGAAVPDRQGGQRLWQIALLAMLVSVVGEGLLGRRMG